MFVALDNKLKLLSNMFENFNNRKREKKLFRSYFSENITPNLMNNIISVTLRDKFYPLVHRKGCLSFIYDLVAAFC